MGPWSTVSLAQHPHPRVLTPQPPFRSARFLRDWYARIGYRQIRTGRLAGAYPALQPRLATPCDFVIYRKNL
jgi:hypothetical protein